MRFTLEIVGPDRRIVGREDLQVAAETDIWSRVAASAQGLKDQPHARLRVVDGQGGIIVLTSVAAALLAKAQPAA